MKTALISISLLVLLISCDESSMDIQPPTMYDAIVYKDVIVTKVEYTDITKTDVKQTRVLQADSRDESGVVKTFERITFQKVKELEKQYNSETETLTSMGSHTDYHRKITIKVQSKLH